jgi:DNA mismatch repair protein MutS
LFLYRLQPGGADRSYGIEVGKLAGLPEPVIARAREVLRLLEGEAERMVPTLASGATATSRGGRRATMPPTTPTDQLGLFAPGGPHPVVERLRDIDVNTLTPIAALQLLAELAERARRA